MQAPKKNQRRGRSLAPAVLLAVLVLGTGVSAQEAEEAQETQENQPIVETQAVQATAERERPAPTTLPEIGMEFERARLLPPDQQKAAVERVARYLEEFEHGDVPSEDRAAMHFLAGEISYALGDYQGAMERFHKAEKDGKKGPFRDEATFALIETMEAAGRDEKADKAWEEWIDDYHDDNAGLACEALLSRAWNAMRRDTLELAAEYLDQLGSQCTWMQVDPRVVLARAAVAYLNGRAGEACSVLDTGAPTEGDAAAAATYLRALCRQSDGSMLEAAASFQEVAERFPFSTLRDYALLAKANIFLMSGAYRSAADEFERVAGTVTRSDVRAEAELRRAACVFMDGDADGGGELLRNVTEKYEGTDWAARAQYLLGEVLYSQEQYDEAIVEFNRVLRDYFDHNLASSAQYRVGRSLDALGRKAEATSSYQAVVSGYSTSREAPAAAYLAGVGLLDQGLPTAAAPYFQLVLDRYAKEDGTGSFVFSSPNHQELVEAALCLLELSYHRAGDMGQLSGVPHLMLQKMPPSESFWRACALLIDADALAAQARYDEAQQVLETLIAEYPDHQLGVPANRLLAWTYSQQGHDELAIQTEEGMLARYAATGDMANLSSAFLNKAHILFNRKEYEQAAQTYDEFLQRFPDHPRRQLALYQAGLAHLRLGNSGDAVDRWEELVQIDPGAEIAEHAWVRSGDVYFQAQHYEEAKRCYQGLLENFSQSQAAALGMLRLAQCDYNAGRDREALEGYSAVTNRFPGTGIAAEAERGMEMALYRLGQREDGTEVLAELVERYPNSSFAADAQFKIAMQAYEDERYHEAAEEFRRVVSQFPGYSAADRAHFLMGDAYEKAGLGPEAEKTYEQFMMFFPSSDLRSSVRFRLATIRFEEGDYMRAAVDFTSVMESETSEETRLAALFNLALCRAMLGQNQGALEALESYREQAGEGDERASEVAQQMGDIHEKAGRFEEAAAEFERAIALDPAEDLVLELHYRMGFCREQAGDKDGAVKAYRKAQAFKPGDDAFRLSAVARLAALYEEKNELKNAISAYQDLIRNATDSELVVAAKERVSQLERDAE
jgi:TolA-binding protein